MTATSSGFATGILDIYKPNTGFYVDGGLQQACPNPGTDSYANCSVQLTMPGDSGTHTIKASNSNGESAFTTFTAVHPRLYIDPTCGPGGTSISVSGYGWSVGFDAGIYVDGALVVGSNLPDSEGNFILIVSGPTSPDGLHLVEARNSVFEDVLIGFTLPVCPVIGNVTDVVGIVTVGTIQLHPGDLIHQNDIVHVAGPIPTHHVDITRKDNGTVSVPPPTDLKQDEYTYDPVTHQCSSRDLLLGGALLWLSGLCVHTLPDNETLETPYGVIGVRGAQFIVRTGAVNTEVYLLSGTVSIRPFQSLTTTVFTGPVKIVFDATSVTTSSLTQEQYDAIKARLL